MKIIYIDIVSAEEHKNYNYGLLRNIPAFVSLDICMKAGYTDALDISCNKYIPIPDKHLYKHSSSRKLDSIYMRLKTLSAYFWVKHNVNLADYDLVIFAYTEIITFVLALNCINTRVAYAYHEVGQTADSFLKSFFFNRINKSYEFIAFENYIADYVSRNFSKRQIWLVKHPLPKISFKIQSSMHKKKMLFAPAISNDECFVAELLRRKSEIPSDVNIVIRSKILEYSDDNLTIYKTKLSTDEYYSLMSSANMVLIHYGNDYNYRTSGVFYEAIALKKQVLLFSKNTLEYYSRQYPLIVKPFYSTDGFFDFITSKLNKCAVESSCFSTILNDYSEESIQQELLTLITNTPDKE